MRWNINKGIDKVFDFICTSPNNKRPIIVGVTELFLKIKDTYSKTSFVHSGKRIHKIIFRNMTAHPYGMIESTVKN